MTSGKKVLTLIAICAIGFTIAFWGKIFGAGYTPQVKDTNGRVIPESIAILEAIELGGMDQSVLMRGHDRGNPILLWLHGGPGSSQMPVAHQFDKELEKEFIVVHWDQRGSGKSNPSDFNEKTMTYEQFISDAHQLTEYLKERFDKEKIYLLGHSWGTQLGLELAARYPEHYYSYIGVAQVTNSQLHTEVSYNWLLEKMDAEEASKDLKKALIALRSTEYTLRDYWAWIDGSNRGSGRMWNEDAYSSFDAKERFPIIKVPIYFFTGKNDCDDSPRLKTGASRFI